MIKKRLVQIVPDSKKYIAGNVLFQWIALISNIVFMTMITSFIATLAVTKDTGDLKQRILQLAAVLAVCFLIRFICNIFSARMSYKSSKTVKKTLRNLIYEKLLRLGVSYNEKIKTSELVQITVEGVDQLETYFGAYLPQFFYAMLAPLTLFVYVCTINVTSAVILLICVPLIPISIAAVQTWAKKLLSKYWDQYTALGDTFLENLQGLTTLKIYQADEYKNSQMNEESEKFRKITMKVLTMQLNSISIMDFVAYGGAALGLIVSVLQFRSGHIDMAGCLLIILLSADFFIPMRQLGSFFHIAMNGMAASDKIFHFLDMKESEKGNQEFPDNHNISFRNVQFAYETERPILKNINVECPMGSFTAIVGESGCGKSTLLSHLYRLLPSKDKITLNQKALESYKGREFAQLVAVLTQSRDSMIDDFLVKDIVLMGRYPYKQHFGTYSAEDVKIAEHYMNEVGITHLANEQIHHLSGGEKQRVFIAKALTQKPQILLLDEPTNHLDMKYKVALMKQLRAFKGTTIVVLHDLNLAAQYCDHIVIMNKGTILKEGSPTEVLTPEILEPIFEVPFKTSWDEGRYHLYY